MNCVEDREYIFLGSSCPSKRKYSVHDFYISVPSYGRSDPLETIQIGDPYSDKEE